MIRKCAYCGSYGVEISGKYWAYCPECGAEGPKMDTEEEAGAEWDKVAGAIATDTNVGHEIPLPVKRDERGEIEKQTVKQLFSKINEELDELKEAVQIGVAGLRSYACDSYISEGALEIIADEAADTITAITTLCEAIGIDADARAAAIARCNKRNQDRGRL